MRKPIIAGNWKMHKTVAEAMDFAKELSSKALNLEVETVICCPFTALGELSKALSDTAIKVGAQNVHFEDQGAYTGEISAAMLMEAGARYVILGHSERREYFAETDEIINKKLKKVLSVGLTPILCVGESLKQRENHENEKVVREQLQRALDGIEKEQVNRLVIAYEPIWAIGTGKTATAEQANEMCGFIRDCIRQQFGDASAVRIQYGGSVKPSNIREIMDQPDIDGALVGGASLLVEDFVKLVNYK